MAKWTPLVMEEEEEISWDCPDFTDADHYWVNFSSFWLEAVAGCCVASVGLVANVVCIFIFTRAAMWKVFFNRLLAALALADTASIALLAADGLRRTFGFASVLHLEIFPHFLYPATVISMTASMYMTVAIAFERYMAVRSPFKYHGQAMKDNSNWFCLFKYVAVVVFLSVVVNLTKFFEAELGEVEDHSQTVKKLRVTALRQNPTYVAYNSWFRLVIVGLIPFLLLMYLNMKTFLLIRKHNKEHLPSLAPCQTSYAEEQNKSHGSFSTSASISSRRRRQENNLAMVFMGIVAVFFICHLPRVALLVHETLVIGRVMACSMLGQHSFEWWALVSASASHPLLIVNSSVNMLLYVALSKEFRRNLVCH